MPFTIAPTALREIKEIWNYVARNNGISSANQLIDEFYQLFELISEHPKIARTRDDIAPGLRGIPVGIFIVFYRLSPNEIVRVLDGRRDLSKIFSQSDS